MQVEDTLYEYRITVEGNLHKRWSDWFSDMRIAHIQTKTHKPLTILQGPVPDQSALRGMLIKLWDLNLILVAVKRVDSVASKEKTYE
jgi:hypothetical protein